MVIFPLNYLDLKYPDSYAKKRKLCSFVSNLFVELQLQRRARQDERDYMEACIDYWKKFAYSCAKVRSKQLSQEILHNKNSIQEV